MRRGVVGEEGEGRDATLLPVGKAPAEKGLLTRLMNIGAKTKAGLLLDAVGHRPASDDAGEVGDIGLGVAGGRADRMQFEAFAGQILVEAPARPCTDRAVRAHRPGIVEVEQHRRVPHHGQQHVAEPPRHVRPDGCADEIPTQRTGAAAAEADGEMVGPEPHQPLPKRPRCGERICHHRLQLGAKQTTHCALRAGWRWSGAVLLDGRKPVGNGCPVWAAIRASELIAEPGCRVTRNWLLSATAEAEADQRVCSGIVHNRSVSGVW